MIGRRMARVLGAVLLTLATGFELARPGPAAAAGVTITTVIHDADHHQDTTFVVGSAIHPRVVVTGLLGTPTGSVTVSLYTGATCLDAPVMWASEPLVSGIADAGFGSRTMNATGTFSIRAWYSGSGLYAGKLGPCVAFSVAKAPAEAYLRVLDEAGRRIDTASVGQQVTIEVEILEYDDLPPPTGRVEFSGSWTDADCRLAGRAYMWVSRARDGIARAPATFGESGVVVLRAFYDGNDLYDRGSTSPCEDFLAVEKAAPAVVLAIHDAAHDTVLSVPYGTSVHPVVSITGPFLQPTGIVDVEWFPAAECDGPRETTSATLVNGLVDVTALSRSAGTPGTSAFQATYRGDAAHLPAVGPCRTYTMLAPTSTVRPTSTPTPRLTPKPSPSSPTPTSQPQASAAATSAAPPSNEAGGGAAPSGGAATDSGAGPTGDPAAGGSPSGLATDRPPATPEPAGFGAVEPSGPGAAAILTLALLVVVLVGFLGFAAGRWGRRPAEVSPRPVSRGRAGPR